MIPHLRLLACGAFAGGAAPPPRAAAAPAFLPLRRCLRSRPSSSSLSSWWGGIISIDGSEPRARSSFGRCGPRGAFLRRGRRKGRAPLTAAKPPIVATTTTRLFGSKPGKTAATKTTGDEEEEEGEIVLVNNSSTPPPPGCPPLSLPSLERALSSIRRIIGYPTYDVALVLTDDEEMRETNLETRGVDAPTDVLSFPFGECRWNDETGRPVPGSLEPPEFDLPDYYHLGDLMVDVPYVHRRIEEDRRDNEEGGEEEEVGGTDQESESESDSDSDSDSDGHYSDVLVDDDRGVSGAMSTEYDPQRRIEMLLVHGMLHLVGYDHIDDDDYEVMVKREEEVLRELEEEMRRGGSD